MCLYNIYYNLKQYDGSCQKNVWVQVQLSKRHGQMGWESKRIAWLTIQKCTVENLWNCYSFFHCSCRCYKWKHKPPSWFSQSAEGSHTVTDMDITAIFFLNFSLNKKIVRIFQQYPIQNCQLLNLWWEM